MPGMVKVGKTNRDPKDRLRELSAATGIPTPFVLVYSAYFADCLEAEQFVHAMLESSGHRVTSNREFFHATVQEATDAVLKAKASLGGADAEPAPPRIAAMPRRVMRCSATTLWSSFRTQRRPMTTRIGGLARCRTRMSTLRVWSCPLLQRRM